MMLSVYNKKKINKAILQETKYHGVKMKGFQ